MARISKHLQFALILILMYGLVTCAKSRSKSKKIRCSEPMDSGRCDKYVLKYFYDEKSNSCRQFWHGGCGGNGNRFDSMAFCRRICRPPEKKKVILISKEPLQQLAPANLIQAPPNHDIPSPVVSDLCELPKSRGHCSNYTLRWFFDNTAGRCMRFWYGNCGGNDNRFDDRESCVNRCLRTKLRPEGCSTSVFGCCADNVTFARGEDRKGCPETRLIGGCAGTRHGCCDDGLTSASGPDKRGCPETPLVGGCAGTRHGCCRDRKTAATGPGKQGCPENEARKLVGGCRGTRYGCCRDGMTYARGDNYLGCPENPMVRCRLTRHGCCQDGRTPARGPNKKGCPETRTTVKTAGCGSTQYGCCPDGVSFAEGPSQEGCPEFNTKFCGYDKDPGGCADYSRQWFYHAQYGVCREFWYGGCRGNANRFQNKEECEKKCVHVSGTDRCNLPLVKGPCRAKLNRFYFDHKEGQCKPFVYGGCRSNANNFKTHGECAAACNGKVSTEGNPATACDTNPCQNDFNCKVLSNGSYSCSCNPDWGRNCDRPPSYWCFSDDECGRGLKCVRERTCTGSDCHVYARCAASSGRYNCDTQRCSAKQDCVNDRSFKDGYFCMDKVRNPRPSPVILDCRYSKYGCCDDRRTPAMGPNKENCYRSCQNSVFGCCPDGKSKASGPDYEGCVLEGSGDVPCERTDYGCCDDGVTAAQGYRKEGCQDTTDNERTTRPTPVTRRPQVGIVKCTAPVSRRRCKELVAKWHYDTKLMKCGRHWFGGCEDNGNVFDTRRDCEITCRRRRPVVVTAPTPTDPDFINICDLPKDPGPCRAAMPRFFYDPKDRSCKNFTYGGCRGNENNFRSFEVCRKECMRDWVAPTTPTPTEQTMPPPSRSTMRMSGPDTLEENTPLRLFCQYQGPERVNIDWFKDGQPISRDGRTDIRFHVMSDDRGKVVLRSEVLIRSVRMEDAGTYLCRSTTGNSESMRVTIVRGERRTTPTPRPTRPTRPPTRKPVVQFPSENLMSGVATVRPGETITITCRAQGPRRPSTMEWFINGRIVSPNAGTADISNTMDRADRTVLISTLSIPNAGENNNGRYYCRSRPYGDIQKMDIKVVGGRVPVTPAPTRRPVTPAPTRRPVTPAPTRRPVTPAPTRRPVTPAPTRRPVTPAPTRRPVTAKPETNEDVCMMPEKTGRCRASFPRWRYNHLEGRCVQFIYGGCDGNSNNFETEADCNRYCQARDICFKPKKVGRCRASMPRFYFDRAQEKCQQFIFGGCSPNANNFMTMEACERKCGQFIKRTVPVDNTTTTTGGGNVCDEMAEKGSCRGYNIKWYYNKGRNACSRFVYTGCDGNGNRFDTQDACQDQCVRTDRVVPTRRPRPPVRPRTTTTTTTTVPTPVLTTGGPSGKCISKYDAGNCYDYKIRWYYDTSNRRCLQFYYGGCGGNDNRFESRAECQSVCVRGIVPVRPVTPRPTQRPVTCQYSRYGCCRDGVTTAVDRQRSNCPEFVRPVTPRPTRRPQTCKYSRYGCCRDGVTTAVDRQRSNCPEFVRPVTPRPTRRPHTCKYSRYGCCRDGVTTAVDRQRSNCPEYVRPVTPRPTQRPVTCQYSRYGCCRDGVTTALDRQRSNCPEYVRPVTPRPTQRPIHCHYSRYGCCQDGVTTAVDRQRSNCQDTIDPATGTDDYNIIRASQGSDVLLQCPMRSGIISWYREGFILTASSRFVTYNNGSLILRDLTQDMAGYYACRYSSNNNRPQLERFKVEINTPLTLVPGPTSIYLKPGDNGFLHCQASGNPQPTVSWKRDGKELRTTTRHRMFGNGTLIISNAQPNDEGRYVCVAENRVSQPVSRTISLTIKELLEANIDSHTGIYNEGDTIRLNCKARGYPKPEIHWEKEGRRIRNEVRRTVRDGELVVRSTSIDDSGTYECVASNDKGSISDSTYVQIQLQSPKKCEDTMRHTKCSLIVAGRLCGFRMFAVKCCQSCRNAGYL